MTVTITSPVFGKVVDETYTGPEEAWLLAHGYAKQDNYGNDVAATVLGSADAVDIVTGGNLVVAIDGNPDVTIALLAADTPAAVVTKIDTALAGQGDASLVSGNLQIASLRTGSKSSVEVVSGTGTVLANLFLTAGQSGVGSDGGVGAANTGSTDVLPDQDPTQADNREDPGLDYQFGDDTELAPVLLSIEPAVGAAGDTVTIYGDNMIDATGATVGGVALTSFDVLDDNSVSGVLGAHADGVVDVVVTDPTGSDTLTGAFTYDATP